VKRNAFFVISRIAKLAALGNYFRGIDSLISSHVKNESQNWADYRLGTDEAVSTWLHAIYSETAGDAGLIDGILSLYASQSYASEADRVKDYLRDNLVTCNNRWVSAAFPNKAYNLQYSIDPAIHAIDIFPTFYDDGFKISGITIPILPPTSQIILGYQSYFISHARSGDPNTYRSKTTLPPTVEWNPVEANGAELVAPILDVTGTKFSLTEDLQNSAKVCDFWLGFQDRATKLSGYSVN
jgi:hypothetical protein